MSDLAIHPLEGVLRLCGQAAPSPWFPRQVADSQGIAADEFLGPLEYLWLEGLIEKSAGAKETGPGFTLTDEGRKVLEDPEALARLRTGSARPPGDRGAIVRAALRQPLPPIISRLFFWANIGVFALGLSLAWQSGRRTTEFFLAGPRQGDLPAALRTQQILQESGAILAENYLAGEWWRLLSCGFVHIGLLHLIMNMYVLYVAGRQTEAMWGRWRFAIIYLVALVGGSCAMVAGSPRAFGAGASGALCGVLASEAVWLFLNRRYLPWLLVSRWSGGLLSTLVLIVVISLVPQVSGWAHLGGALAGAAAAFILNFQRFGPSPWNWLALVGLAPVVWAGFFAIDYSRIHNPQWDRPDDYDFKNRYFQDISQATQETNLLLESDEVSQVNYRPERRDLDLNEKALQKLPEFQTRLQRIVDRLEARMPFRGEDSKQKSEAGLAFLRNLIRLCEMDADCLCAGPDWTAAQEKERVRLQNEKNTTRRAWRFLVTHGD